MKIKIKTEVTFLKGANVKIEVSSERHSITSWSSLKKYERVVQGLIMQIIKKEKNSESDSQNEH